jgi:hypothetical protein
MNRSTFKGYFYGETCLGISISIFPSRLKRIGNNNLQKNSWAVGPLSLHSHSCRYDEVVWNIAHKIYFRWNCYWFEDSEIFFCDYKRRLGELESTSFISANNAKSPGPGLIPCGAERYVESIGTERKYRHFLESWTCGEVFKKTVRQALILSFNFVLSVEYWRSLFSGEEIAAFFRNSLQPLTI